MIRYGFPLLTLAVGACATTNATEAKQCDAAAGQGFVGQPYSETLQSEARAATKSDAVRVIRPGQAVTMDYRIDRLNIELDADDKVAAIRCG